jgi:hypothetical protein
LFPFFLLPPVDEAAPNPLVAAKGAILLSTALFLTIIGCCDMKASAPQSRLLMMTTTTLTISGRILSINDDDRGEIIPYLILLSLFVLVLILVVVDLSNFAISLSCS